MNMLIRKYRFGNHVLGPLDKDFQGYLAKAYEQKSRITCACKSSKPVELYIAKLSSKGEFELRRMPGAGSSHASECAHYEPPLALSGLAQVQGQAIIEHPHAETVELKLDFALTKIPGRTPPSPSGTAQASVKSDGIKLTLRGLLHYLWHCAELNRWHPALAGKRNYGTVFKFIQVAAMGKSAKSGQLMDFLYMPEPYSPDREVASKSRRILKLGQLASQTSAGATKLGLLIGELFEIRPAQFGHQAVFKGALDQPFQINEDLYKRMLKHFKSQLTLWDQHLDHSHLVLIGTFTMDPTTGIAQLNEVAIMNVTKNWIPFDSIYELNLVDQLTKSSRSYWKSLRFNLPPKAPMANLVLTDTSGGATALCIFPPGATDQDQTELMKHLDTERQGMHVWCWLAGEQEIPALPPRLGDA
jgi:hypothetical protein